jgi:hypothetical protein
VISAIAYITAELAADLIPKGLRRVFFLVEQRWWHAGLVDRGMSLDLRGHHKDS